LPPVNGGEIGCKSCSALDKNKDVLLLFFLYTKETY